MFCTQCGNQVDLSSRFCPSCGAPVAASAPPPPPPGYQPIAPRLTRSRDNRMIAGVCAGFAQHYGWDLNLVRVITALVSFFSGGAPASSSTSSPGSSSPRLHTPFQPRAHTPPPESIPDVSHLWPLSLAAFVTNVGCHEHPSPRTTLILSE